jgi:replicative DNA helicase
MPLMSTTRSVDSSKRPPARNGDILDRPLPYSMEAEAGVLGSILLLPDVCDDVALITRPDDFYDEAHRTVFQQMLSMHEEGRKIDVTLLVERLKSAGQFEAIGGAAQLARLGRSVPNAAHAAYYATIVREKATYRTLIETAGDILRDAYDEPGPSNEAVNSAEQRIFAILDSRDPSNVRTISDVLHDAMDRLDARMRGEHTAAGVDSGFAKLDELTGGLHNSELVILAARPSMGKTALALNIAEHVATQQGLPVLFVSLEMSAVELAERMLCSVARVNSHRLRNGTLSQRDRQKLVETANKLSTASLSIDDSPSRTVTEIAAAARRLRRRQKGRLGLLVIDYLQLIEPDNQKDPRQEQVAKITRRLKGLAREMKIPVLCLAQLNRQAEEGRGHEPRLSHLRESGAIEQDADVVMFVHRDEYFLSGDERSKLTDEERAAFEGEAKLLLRKQRNGPTGDVPLTWLKEFTRFEQRESYRDEHEMQFSRQYEEEF